MRFGAPSHLKWRGPASIGPRMVRTQACWIKAESVVEPNGDPTDGQPVADRRM